MSNSEIGKMIMAIAEPTELELPYYSRILCEKSYDLLLPILQELTQDEFWEYLLESLSLGGSTLDSEREAQLESIFNNIEPLSKFFDSSEKTDFFVKHSSALTPLGTAIKGLFERKGSSIKPEYYLAVQVFHQIVMIKSHEDQLLSSDGTCDLKIWTEKLEPHAERLRQLYSILLHLDSEIENIETKLTRVNAAQKKNRPHKEMHEAFFKFYENNKSQWSKSECARRFYRSLPKDKKKLYSTADHAKRQLTDALRRHLKA
jgi:hypothetical protein